MRTACRLLLLTAFYVILLLTFILPRGDRPHLSVEAEAAAGHTYALVSWEMANFSAKWWHRLYTALPWSETSEAQRRADLDRYLSLVDELRNTNSGLRAASSAAQPDAAEVGERQQELDRIEEEIRGVRPSVEEFLEARISSVLQQQGMKTGPLLWPPVDFRVGEPPSVLITSPRDRIERLETVLIDPSTAVLDMEAMERALLERWDLSAIVEPTGGLATYPTVIQHSSDLQYLLEVAAHEWVHSYLFFHPLGQSFNKGGDLFILNETLADMAGREFGRAAFTDITGEPAPPLEPPRDPVASPPPDPGVFDFSRFMRETRLRTDEMLAAGEIEDAEAYMEERRIELNSHGYAFRKINQAYFAFHGSYGESPSAVSPIAKEMYELRHQAGSPGALLRLLKGVTSYERFKAVLERERTGPSTGRR